MQVSCLQMQGRRVTGNGSELLSQIRNEAKLLWAQLRELLTTFRLQLTEPGRPALEASCGVQRARFGDAGYQLPRTVPSHRATLLQNCGEALSNALKHSHADDVVVTVTQWQAGQSAG